MKTFLCISTYHKGGLFLRALKEKGNRVLFITSNKLANAQWPYECIDRFCTVTEMSTNTFDLQEVERVFANLAREEKIDVIIALDDYDVEKAAHLREQFRIDGMTASQARFFRDKLAMRVRAEKSGIPQPRFTALFNDESVNLYADTVPPPWVLKPRSEAAASGIRHIQGKEQLWHHIHELGDERHRFLLEEYIEGDVLHVDALHHKGESVFQRVSRYLVPPFTVVAKGGIFQSMTTPSDSAESIALKVLNNKLMQSFELLNCASHSEYIHDHKTGMFYFLETSARVGGAHLSEMVEAASGFNIWREWAYLEHAVAHDENYNIPHDEGLHAGILMSVFHQEWPDYSSFNDPSIWWKAKEIPHHIGMILQHESYADLKGKMESHCSMIENLKR